MQNSRRLALRVTGLRVHPPPGLAGPASAFTYTTNPLIPCTASLSPTFNNLTASVPSLRETFSTTCSSHADGTITHSVTRSSNSGSSGGIPNPVLQRYSELVEAGKLKRDDQQLALVQELARLYDEICAYKARMDSYHQATAEHQARRLKRLQELLREEEEEQERQRQRQQQRVEEEVQRHQGRQSGTLAVVHTSSSSSSSSSLSGFSGLVSKLVRSVMRAAPLMGGGTAGSADGGGGGGSSDSPLAHARQAAIRREEVLQREIGPPPETPEPPKGMYVWGSVGSGKSMLVALFYQALVENAQLPATRWMHFNAAMLEIHSRLHHLDRERWRLRDERERLHHHHLHHQDRKHTMQKQHQHQQHQQQAQHVQQQRQQDASSSSSSSSAAAAAAAVVKDDLGDGEEDEEDADSTMVMASGGGGCGGRRPGGRHPPSAAAEEGDDLPVPEHLQGVFRHWDPRQDPEVRRQREAKAAMLAVRRHMRLARLGRNDPRTLAAANAQGLMRVAASFIRGRAGEPGSGWGAVRGPLASLLYFDEVQVTDVFSAVALKGLVEALTSAGCVLVCTSNRSPGDLPRHGLHEEMWGHFVETLLQRCTVHELSSTTDYRRILLEQGRAEMEAAVAAAAAATDKVAAGSSRSSSGLWPPLSRSYILAAGAEGRAELERVWRALAEGARQGAPGNWSRTGGSETAIAAGAAMAAGSDLSEGREEELPPPPPQQQQQEAPLNVPVLFGRTLEVRRSSPCGGAAWFSFAELCGRPLGPADYLALSQKFHTVFVEGIPPMSMQVRDQARRFITLIDELYNCRCVLVVSAEAPPEELFSGAEGQEPILDLESLQFETAVEGARLRRDVMAPGGVAPVASSSATLAATVGALGGAEERFAFRRAVSRLLEMQSPQYILGALRLRRQQQQQHAQQV